MLNNLLKLAALTGRADYRTRAREVLEAWSGLLEKAGLEMAWWVDAAVKLIGPYHDVVIAGDREDENTRRPTSAVLTLLPASAVVSLVPAGGAPADLVALAPVLEGKTAAAGDATAYVCEYGTCQAPTSDSAQVRKQVLRGWMK